MEYQKRLKFIEYIKKNFIVQKEETIVFYFKNYDELDLVAAQKIRSVIENSEYHISRDELKLGKCILSDTFGAVDFDQKLDFSFLIFLKIGFV